MLFDPIDSFSRDFLLAQLGKSYAMLADLEIFCDLCKVVLRLYEFHSREESLSFLQAWFHFSSTTKID